MSRDKPAKARRDAQKDMRREGFSTGPCRHRNTQTTYEYDGKGTEHCTKFCNDCGSTVRKWTNHA